MATPRVSSWPLSEGVTSATVNGYDMAYVERGAGVAVVFVHGSALDYRYFSPQMEPFGEHHRAIAVSLRHCYPEPWRGDGEFSLDQHALDLTTFIRQVVSEPVHVVGYSRGGTVSLYAARLAPDLIRTLTFAEGGAGMQTFAPEEPALRDLWGRAMQTMAARLASGDVDGGLAGYVDFAVGPGAWDKLPQAVRGFFRDNAWTLAAASRYTLSPFSCADALALDLPVLLLGGDSSPPQFGAILDRLQPCLRRAERAVVANASHGMSRSNSAEFNAAVLAFISKY
jgi:pimeloyl-ACP methyl ester carboxylesterase